MWDCRDTTPRFGEFPHGNRRSDSIRVLGESSPCRWHNAYRDRTILHVCDELFARPMRQSRTKLINHLTDRLHNVDVLLLAVSRRYCINLAHLTRFEHAANPKANDPRRRANRVRFVRRRKPEAAFLRVQFRIMSGISFRELIRAVSYSSSWSSARGDHTCEKRADEMIRRCLARGVRGVRLISESSL